MMPSYDVIYTVYDPIIIMMVSNVMLDIEGPTLRVDITGIESESRSESGPGRRRRWPMTRIQMITSSTKLESLAELSCDLIVKY